MMRLKLLIAMPLLAMSSACVTREPLRIVTDTSCTAFNAISYAQLAKGQVDDPGNKADSDATVAEIDAHNARYDALCGQSKPSADK